MRANNCLSASVLLFVTACAASAADPEPVPPAIGPVDQQFLTQLVRRTIEERIADESTYTPTYVPPSLRTVRCQMIVTLRQAGHVRGQGTSEPRSAVNAARDAALAALADAAGIGPVTKTWLSRVRIEMEAVGKAEYVNFTGQWSDPLAFVGIIEPGVHGVALRYGQARKQFAPSEIISKCADVRDAIRNLAQQLVATPEEFASTQMYRFRSTHWHELEPDGKVVELKRGVVVIAQDEVTDALLEQTITRLADYMVYRQLPSGWFSYQYEPSSDTYIDEDNRVRQAAVGWSMARYARLYEKSATEAAATKALDRLLNHVVDLEGIRNASFVAGLDNRHKLGITAFAVLAAYDHPEAERYRDVRDRLLNGIYWLQQPSGQFITAFPPSTRLSSQYFFPGEALVAIARSYEAQPNQRAVDAFKRAHDYYSDLFEDDPVPPFVPWQTQAFATMAERTRRADYAEFVYRMTDWLISKQCTPENCKWPELWGGIAAYEGMPPGVATAAYLEGLTESLRLARSRGDTERAERYEDAVRLAARFVIQLQLRPEEAYYMRSMPDAVWGIRTTLSENHLRIDHCQHALMALMKSRELLFNGPG